MRDLARTSPISQGEAGARVATGVVQIVEAPPRAKLLLMGDPAELARALPPECVLPLRPNSSVTMPGIGMSLWLRPDQYLLLFEQGATLPPRQIAAVVTGAETQALYVGARFVEFLLEGPIAATLLNCGCGLDLRDRSFPIGASAQTRIEQVPVMLVRSATHHYEVLVERPLARHLWLWMRRAATEI